MEGLKVKMLRRWCMTVGRPSLEAAIAVQKALLKAMAVDLSFAGVPAVTSGAIYSLPGFSNASVVEFPDIMKQWAFVLEN